MITYDYLQTTNGRGGMFVDVVDRREFNSDILFAVHVFQGETPEKEPERIESILEDIWTLHNLDNRPRGQDIRSMSVGDFLVIWRGEGDPRIFFCCSIGWEEVKPTTPTFRSLESAAGRRAYTTIKTPELLKDLRTVTPTGSSR